MEAIQSIVLSWIMNTVSENLLSGIVYASNAHLVWEDLKESFDKVNRVRIFQVHTSITNLKQAPSPNCGCPKSRDYIEYLQQQRLMQFLSGLNESYDQAKRQILMKSNAPTVNQAYALIVQDESQQANIEKSDPIAMQVKRNNGYKGGGSMYCEHCHMRNHIKKDCYKLIGYPSERDNKHNRRMEGNYEGYRKDNNREGWKNDRFKDRYRRDNNEGWRRDTHAAVANNADFSQGRYAGEAENRSQHAEDNMRSDKSGYYTSGEQHKQQHTNTHGKDTEDYQTHMAEVAEVPVVGQEAAPEITDEQVMQEVSEAEAHQIPLQADVAPTAVAREKPTRMTKQPGWLNDYITNTSHSGTSSYPIDKYSAKHL
ncbi:hypothetical protein H5410_035109 [Solanum commersonii]|uniref:Retrotransposon gag domain-containing protein n=1 Tax=Solanum commersonii TaxID=4109 RepID=A0A9J5Y108_SOLCO|nr:hypothetical protein H5410_035109 [Solanum commersonii]